MTVGICDMDEALTLEKVVVDNVANDVASAVPDAVVKLVTELDDEGEVLVGITIVTTVLIREVPVGLATV
jgi:hypothetical protein